ncbi:MAG: class I SAM-dependent rRNA methyltransferase, partial [Chloroflexota bacterium]
AVHVRPAAERALRYGHPWVFEDSIKKLSFEGQPGNIAVIFDQKDRFLAVGLYDPESEIRIKVLQHGKGAKINRDWFQQTLQTAAHIREPLAASGHTNGYRLVYGENDHLPGFVVDRYAETLVVKLYTSAWLPHLRDVLPVLMAVQRCERLVLRMSRNMESVAHGLHDGMVLYGDMPDGPVEFTENSLCFAADVIHGHKTGYFFDQRDNRQRVRELSSGADVLDVFAYSGGFSVYAAAGGAKSVLSTDISGPALDSAKHNFALNRDVTGDAHHETLLGDAFEVLQQLKNQRRQFDVVVIDPPAFAKRQSEVDGALGAYARLAEVGSRLVRDGGHFVMASCSSRVNPAEFFAAVEHAIPFPLRNPITTGHALDHPVTFPEGEYLKCLFTQFAR